MTDTFYKLSDTKDFITLFDAFNKAVDDMIAQKSAETDKMIADITAKINSAVSNANNVTLQNLPGSYVGENTYTYSAPNGYSISTIKVSRDTYGRLNGVSGAYVSNNCHCNCDCNCNCDCGDSDTDSN